MDGGPRRLQLVVNPVAGGGRATRRLPDVLSALADTDLVVTPTESLEHAGELAAAAVADDRTVVAMGGDGLVGRVAGVVADKGGLLAVVPGGRGNDFARAVGIPREAKAACAALLEGVETLVDLGMADGTPFLGIASIGFDSSVQERVLTTRLRLGPLVYLYGALTTVAAWEPATFRCTVDGVPHEVRGWSVAVSNSGRYGGGMRLAPDASVTDGLLDVVSTGRLSRWGFLRSLPSVFRGTHVRHRAVDVRPARAVVLDADQPFRVFADGDPVATLPCTVTVRPGALRVLLPAPRRVVTVDLDALPAAVIAVDLDHRVVTWSDGAEALYGWSAEEALGRSVRDLILADQVPLADEVAEATHGGAVWEGEMEVRRRDGSTLLVHVRNAPVLDESGAVTGVVGVSLDVVAARRVEMRRADSLGRLQRLTAALVPLQEQSDVVATICTEVVGALGAAAAAVMLLDEGAEHLELAGASGYTDEDLAPFARIAAGPGIPITDALDVPEPLLFPDAAAAAAAYPDLLRADRGYGARACIRVATDDRVLGVLAVSYADAHAFDDDEKGVLVTIARLCGLALERSRMFSAERRARERSAFVDSAATLLASSLDTRSTLQNLTDLLVPGLADYVLVYLLDERGQPVLAAVTHHDPELTTWLRQRSVSAGVQMDAPGGLGEVLRTGTAVFYPTTPADVRARVLDASDGDPRAAELIPTSGLAVPLVAGGRVLGGIGVARTGGPEVGVDDLALVQEIADRAAVAVSHAQAYDRERSAALMLQHSLLPQVVPDLPGVQCDWRYLPGAEGSHVGGDWYDVVRLTHGRVAVLIGDVMGRGLRAAAVMGQLRATARALVSADSTPVEVLAELEQAVSGLEQGSITTALVGVLDPATGVLTYASAGHLPPLHARLDGTSEFLVVDPGPPLGAGADHWPSATATLRPGDTLLLYTDGLVEDRSRQVGEGMEVLRRAVVGPQDPHDACDLALRGTGRDALHDDDTALLAVTLDDEDTKARSFLDVVVMGATAGRTARTALRQRLAAWGVPDEVVEDALVVATELVVNAVLHVGGEVHVVARRGGPRLRLEVHDGSSDVLPLPSLTSLTRAAGRADDLELDAVITALDQGGTTGRGMTLVAGLSSAWGHEQVPSGKAVWAEFDLVTSARAIPPPLDPDEARGRVPVVLRGVPVRLVLASAVHVDDLQRELATVGTAGGADRDDPGGPAPARALGAHVEQLMSRSEPLRLALREAAREALGRGQRLVDVAALATDEATRSLTLLADLVRDEQALAAAGLLTPLPADEVVDFRRWCVEELARQLDGGTPVDCPFAALPTGRT